MLLNIPFLNEVAPSWNEPSVNSRRSGDIVDFFSANIALKHSGLVLVLLKAASSESMLMVVFGDSVYFGC